MLLKITSGRSVTPVILPNRDPVEARRVAGFPPVSPHHSRCLLPVVRPHGTDSRSCRLSTLSLGIAASCDLQWKALPNSFFLTISLSRRAWRADARPIGSVCLMPACLRECTLRNVPEGMRPRRMVSRQDTSNESRVADRRDLRNACAELCVSMHGRSGVGYRPVQGMAHVSIACISCKSFR
ncbi:MAG: hypothetical protein RIS70_3908 [Planctomycetota bacterium]